MMRQSIISALLFASALFSGKCARADGWDNAQRQPAAWFHTAEGRRVVANVLLYQFPAGGWPKNLDIAAPLDDAAQAALAQRRDESTIDNGATYRELRFLARFISETRNEKAHDAFMKGFDYLLAGQYENGGWPQIFPKPTGYHARITFNDDAMAGVLFLLRDASQGAPPFAFVDADRRQRAKTAVDKGIDCILKCQVVTEGRRTAWCAQHDEKTFAPAPARAFEPVSLSGNESVALVRFLMGIEEPSPAVIESVKSAVAWLESAKITGFKVTTAYTEGGLDHVVLEDKTAVPLWARFYEIGTNRPLFTGRDGIVRYNYSEIESERRNGYAYYGTWPAALLEKEYPAWVAKRGISSQPKK